MSHTRIDERSLRFGQAIAERLQADSSLIQRARENIDRWLLTASDRAVPALMEWKMALDAPLLEVIQLLTATDERAVRMRQSNPFAGLLPPSERNAIIRQFHQHDAKST